MHILQTLKDLVNDVLFVDILQDIRSNHCMQVCIHKVEYKIDVTIVLCSYDVLQTNDVFMTSKLLKENDFSKSSLCVSRILKCIEILFERHNFFGSFVNSFPNYTVGSLT